MAFKDIPAEERLIFALDVPDAAAARALAETLGDSVGFYKLGLELLMAGGYFELLDWLAARDKRIFVDLKFFDVPELVLSRARRALSAGCDGVVSSGLEAKMLRDELGSRLMVVTPGIRPVENRPADDQKRVVSVEQAFGLGADYIVVGRPIRDAADPKAAAEAIQASIAKAVGA
jgi:orotidine-5'-phosphate decarboxylase